ncbi:hypothetical protein MtrunA17_Chr8g0352081 [Medicago truncatula]|uniref:Nodule Cysteine-Rich (NCR) secreted peptide n=1 Tax=Medicago truncatula TaxID=3880 RepID=A0A072TPC7_MEDTR|nr:uncharacterized protein LOC11445149 isoform X2 [Medicago truncatula]KEH19066.1 Nodule Cysteine-Rich (NCR) secreted peptide [Medicago truncatula]RHN40189.1 hypothetical protein MtrunA17_Chr8g0352081 [Medicago truncatula]
MDFEVKLSPTLIFFKPYSSHAHGNLEVKCCTQSQSKETTSSVQIKKQCLRCNTLYSDQQNSPVSCSFHGHTNGIAEKECITDDDCNRKYPMHANRGLQCLNGECKSSRIIKSR